MRRRFLLAVSVAVLLGVLITNLPLAYAINPVVVTDNPNDLMVTSGAPAPSQFYLPFIDIVEASATSTLGGTPTYTFEMTLSDTPTNWLTPSWLPTFTKTKASIYDPQYMWSFRDSAGNVIGNLRATFRIDLGGVTLVRSLVCVPPVLNMPAQAEADCGPHSVLSSPYSNDVVGLTFDATTHSVSLTISQSLFTRLFPNASSWRACARVFLAPAGESQIVDVTAISSLPA
jgi:hypothetical protein